MKKILFWILVACIILSFSAITHASLTDTEIHIAYRNIKIIKNGTRSAIEHEPFVYDGHVYISLRDAAKIFSFPVSWDGENNTIILGTREKKWVSLSELSFVQEELKGQEDGSFINVGSSYNEVLSGIRFATIKGQVYKDTLLFGGSGTEYFKYNLDGKYSTFRFLLGANDDSFVTSENDDYAILKVYGDSTLIYTSPPLQPNKEAFIISIPINGVNTLTIEKILNGNSIIKVGVADTRLSSSNK